MFGGGGGMNPRKMEQMMSQMGIDLTDIDAEEVIIRTADEEMVFHDAEVQRMDAQGQQTYQIVGEPDTRPLDGGDGAAAGGSSADTDEAEADAGSDAGGVEIPDDDVEIVAARTGASEEDAREALEVVDGDLAAAVERLE